MHGSIKDGNLMTEDDGLRQRESVSTGLYVGILLACTAMSLATGPETYSRSANHMRQPFRFLGIFLKTVGSPRIVKTSDVSGNVIFCWNADLARSCCDDSVQF